MKPSGTSPVTMKLAENIGSKLLDIDLSDDFLDFSSQAKPTKAQQNMWD